MHPILLLSAMVITYLFALFELNDQSFIPTIDYQSRKQITAPPLNHVDSIIHIHPFVNQFEHRVAEIRLESLTFHDSIIGFISMIAVFHPVYASLLVFVAGYYHHYNDMTLARQIQIAQAIRTGPPNSCSPIDFKQSSIVALFGMFMKVNSINECFNHYQIINQSQSPNPFTVSVSLPSIPGMPYASAQIVGSRDPSQPDRLFRILDLPMSSTSTSIYSIDMRTGQSYPTLNPTNECGFLVTGVKFLAALSDSIMAYTTANQTINNQSSRVGVVIMRFNHTTGECIRAWRVNVSDDTAQEFAVDEANQQFALPTLYLKSSYGSTVLSLFSMATGNVVANTTVCGPVSFDPILGGYLTGPSRCPATSGLGQYQQFSPNNLTLIGAFDMGFGTPGQLFFDQVGSFIVGPRNPGYIYSNNVRNSFVTDVVGDSYQYTSLLNHDVVLLIGSVVVRFSQYPVYPASSSSAPVPWAPSSSSSSNTSVSSSSSSASVSSTASSLSSGQSAGATGVRINTDKSSNTSESEGSSEWSTGEIAALVVGLIGLVGLCALIGLSLSYCKRRSEEIKARSESRDNVLLTSA